jgi:hypothetical protein
MSGKIFVICGRGVASQSAGRLRDGLADRMPEHQILDDTGAVADPASADLILALVRRSGRNGEPADDVRPEVADALRRGTTIVPVLMDGAELPAEKSLPPGFNSSVVRRGMVIDTDTFDADADRLAKTLAGTIADLVAKRQTEAAAKRRVDETARRKTAEALRLAAESEALREAKRAEARRNAEERAARAQRRSRYVKERVAGQTKQQRLRLAARDRQAIASRSPPRMDALEVFHIFGPITIWLAMCGFFLFLAL